MSKKKSEEDTSPGKPAAEVRVRRKVAARPKAMEAPPLPPEPKPAPKPEPLPRVLSVRGRSFSTRMRKEFGDVGEMVRKAVQNKERAAKCLELLATAEAEAQDALLDRFDANGAAKNER